MYEIDALQLVNKKCSCPLLLLGVIGTIYTPNYTNYKFQYYSLNIQIKLKKSNDAKQTFFIQLVLHIPMKSPIQFKEPMYSTNLTTVLIGVNYVCHLLLSKSLCPTNFA